MPPLPPRSAEHLRLLALFHYVVAGLAALLALLPLVHLAFGIAILGGWLPEDRHGSGPPRVLGLGLILFAGAFVLLGELYALLLALAGRALKQRRRYRFCFAMACVSCLFSPFGTVLGIFTILVLVQEDVRAAFGVAPA